MAAILRHALQGGTASSETPFSVQEKTSCDEKNAYMGSAIEMVMLHSKLVGG